MLGVIYRVALVAFCGISHRHFYTGERMNPPRSRFHLRKAGELEVRE